MNERIKELEMQVARSFDPLKDWDCSEQEYAAEFNRRFAELIIGNAIECVRDVLRDENSDLTYTAASQVQTRIKEYFGVEE